MKKKKKILFLFFAFVFLNLLVFGSFYFSLNKQESAKPILNVLQNKNSNISPTPFPFQELTVLYLRNKEYQSSLGNLNEVTDASAYTGYLTSYQSEGFRINAYLTIPKGNKPEKGWPAIVFVHGYIPPSNYQTLSNYSLYVDYLANNGFVVFKIDLRGNGNSEGEPGGGYFSGDYVMDVLNAKAALQGSDFVDGSRIGFWGHSMAGNVISRAMAASPFETKAIAIWAGAVYTYEDRLEFGIDDNSYQPPSSDTPSRRKRNELFEKYGQFDPNSIFWKQVPMTNYLTDIKGAISLNHAKDDNVVSIEYSRNLAEILEDNSIKYELNEYDGGGHNITGSYFNEAMQKTVNFFKKEL